MFICSVFPVPSCFLPHCTSKFCSHFTVMLCPCHYCKYRAGWPGFFVVWPWILLSMQCCFRCSYVIFFFPLLFPPTGLALLAVLPVITAWQTILGEPGAPFTALLVSMPPVCSNFHLTAVPLVLALHLSPLRTCTSIIHYYTEGEIGQSEHWEKIPW